MSQEITATSRKDLAPYQDLGRGPFTSYYRRVAVKSAPVSDPPTDFLSRLASFATGHWWDFFIHVMHYAGSRRHTFQTYGRESGVYTVDEDFSLAVAGDWGTGTDEAYEVMEAMCSENCHFNVHLGDVYYVGNLHEMRTNCFGEHVGRHIPVKWKPGTQGTFALSGNHEMYARGTAYFRDFLPRLGLKKPNSEEMSGQKASFFCLQNEHWRIIGLDTGYNSAGIFFTLLNNLSKLKWIKWFRKAPYFKPSSRLEHKLLEWLRAVVKNDSKGKQRATVLLSHHQYFSGFDDWFRIPGQQLFPILGNKRVLWFWGHEHRFALYDHFQIKGGIDAYGRCIGHGGMPVERGHGPDIHDCKCILWDNRAYSNTEGLDVGYNGFAALRFEGKKLKVDYYDLKKTHMLTEEWWTDDDGELLGPFFSYVHPHMNTHDPAYFEKHSQPPQPAPASASDRGV